MLNLIDRAATITLFGLYPLAVAMLGNGSIALALLAPLVAASFVGRMADLKFAPPRLVSVVLILLIAYAAIHVVVLSNELSSVRVLAKIVLMAAVAPLAARVLLKSHSSSVAFGLMVVTVVALTFTFEMFRFGSVRLASYYSGGASDATTVSNWMAALMLPFAPLLVQASLDGKNTRLLGRIGLVLGTVAVIMSQSRAAYVIWTLLGVWIFWIARPMQKIAFLMIVALVALPVGYGLREEIARLSSSVVERFSYIDPSFADYLGVDYDEKGADRKSVREALDESGRAEWVDNQVFGFGFHNTVTLVIIAEHAENGIIAHNTYLGTGLYEMGVVGLMLFAALLLSASLPAVRGWLHLRKRDPVLSRQQFALLVGLLIVICQGWFRPQLDNPTFFLFLIAGGRGFIPLKHGGFNSADSSARNLHTR